MWTSSFWLDWCQAGLTERRSCLFAVFIVWNILPIPRSTRQNIGSKMNWVWSRHFVTSRANRLLVWRRSALKIFILKSSQSCSWNYTGYLTENLNEWCSCVTKSSCNQDFFFFYTAKNSSFSPYTHSWLFWKDKRRKFPCCNVVFTLS